MILPDSDLIVLVNRRRDAWRDVQFVEALGLCGFSGPEWMAAFDEALLAYEEAANSVEDARCRGV